MGLQSTRTQICKRQWKCNSNISVWNKLTWTKWLLKLLTISLKKKDKGKDNRQKNCVQVFLRGQSIWPRCKISILSLHPIHVFFCKHGAHFLIFARKRNQHCFAVLHQPKKIFFGWKIFEILAFTLSKFWFPLNYNL